MINDEAFVFPGVFKVQWTGKSSLCRACRTTASYGYREIIVARHSSCTFYKYWSLFFLQNRQAGRQLHRVDGSKLETANGIHAVSPYLRVRESFYKNPDMSAPREKRKRGYIFHDLL